MAQADYEVGTGADSSGNDGGHRVGTVTATKGTRAWAKTTKTTEGMRKGKEGE